MDGQNITQFIEKQIANPQFKNSSQVILFNEKNLSTIMTSQRRIILEFLRKENPYTIQDLIKKFGKTTESDLNILEHLGLILLEKESDEVILVKLNRDVEVITI